ncbi:uncharacterized protein MKK02DRAFT_32052 [Dioszegia hungarica]|uniref:DUF2231 domain-containing protein n=1 Tax=Dioszegia hungarica TaxID=4972 RepID=A0AA38LWR3_9TREE|nr:uncharacterized protein MKK02DRAFT_32052 [Dioszegia hungarica]KAI9638655.1 hypothetical protein MKK02DRAFT_32052 [Dioszegia hungarica]
MSNNPQDLRKRASEAADSAKDQANRAVNTAEDKANSSPAIRAAEDAVHKGSTFLQGQIPNSDVAMGHPIHPSTVHFPIAFLSAAFGLTSLSLLPTSLYPSSILPATGVIPGLAYYSAAAGVITAAPAIITGLGEAYELIRKERKVKGSWGAVADATWNMSDTGGQKVKTTLTHASMNDMVVALAGYNWYRGAYYPSQALPKWVIYGNALALPALLYSAYLGGKLVYEYAMGVQRQGAGLDIKKQMAKEK